MRFQLEGEKMCVCLCFYFKASVKKMSKIDMLRHVMTKNTALKRSSSISISISSISSSSSSISISSSSISSSSSRLSQLERWQCGLNPLAVGEVR